MTIFNVKSVKLKDGLKAIKNVRCLIKKNGYP